ncbi:heterokaryon incompatibility protein-domain-containing protein [Diplogelasinospora grovesii]|uniref:Heterokaryon incompatibility protein-domain-containing protein n=1 Tax=Diplogelasinospora grovesii TaxID=303347 RepID=A0AAN6MXM2_9PEZI|nr:heterokaryon incompatibility protein-domain-containing protein [Diplogelasinospora grovesii]
MALEQQEYGRGVDFCYEPLKGPSDTIRLIVIEPTNSDADDPIITCSISHMRFDQRPQYEALSYMWGDEPATRRILLNGKGFLIKQHLYDALHFFRRQKPGILYWIDAICINQDDVSERNSQVRIMPHIYGRAQTVVIWLGKRYLEANRELWEPMLDDGYWQRVWIIQELGKARKIEICFSPSIRTWSDFIIQVEKDSTSTHGPMRLKSQLAAKYKDGHTLRRLLETHKDAKCKIPHDKVYGLVGLATDCRGFPVDYNKSIFEVWKDTMTWVTWNYRMSTKDTVTFGRLAKEILIESNVGITTIIPKEYHESPIRRSGDITFFGDITMEMGTISIQPYVLGQIVHLGPPPNILVDNLEETDRWMKEIQENYPINNGAANWENDQLIDAIFNTKELDLSMVSGISSRIRSRFATGFPFKTYDPYYGPKTTAKPYRTFQMHDHKGKTSDSQLCRLGIAPGEAQRGDLVCWVPNIARAILVRLMDGYAQVIGTSILAHEVFSIPEHNKLVKRFNDGDFSDSKDIRFTVDAETAYALILLV